MGLSSYASNRQDDLRSMRLQSEEGRVVGDGELEQQLALAVDRGL
jgi:hypothetical protein